MGIDLCDFGALNEHKDLFYFRFYISNYSKIKCSKISDFFYHEGQVWKLQILKRNGYFGMFLRWYATEEEYNLKPKASCVAQTTFHIINRVDQDKNIHHGDHADDEFLYVTGGIGYGKIIKLEGLKKTPGFLLNDSLLVEIQIRLKSIKFKEEVSFSETSRGGYFSSSIFQFWGTGWRLIWYVLPQQPGNSDGDTVSETSIGDPGNNKVNKEEVYGKESNVETDSYFNGENDSSNEDDEYLSVALYLSRESSSSCLLRHDVVFSLHAEEIPSKPISYKFFNEKNSIFGSTLAVKRHKLNEIIKRGSVSLGVTFFRVLPYFYFGYPVNKGPDQPADFGDPCCFQDPRHLLWTIRFRKDPESIVYTDLKMNVDENAKLNKNFVQDKTFIKSLWVVRLLNKDKENKDIIANSEDPTNEMFSFTRDGLEKKVPIKVPFHKLVRPGSSYLDDQNSLFLFISIKESNIIHHISDQSIDIGTLKGIADSYKTEIKMLQEESTVREQILQEQLNASQEEAEIERDNLVKQHEEDKSENEKKLREKNVLISSLQQRLNHFQNYIDSMEQNPVEGKKLYEERSIRKLIETSKPHRADIKILQEISHGLKEIFQNSGLPISDMLVAGALGQDTVTRGKLQLDIVLFFETDPFQEETDESGYDVISSIQDVIETYSIKREDIENSSVDSDTLLPPCSNFLATSYALLFRCAGVSVAVLPGIDVKDHKGYEILYQAAMDNQPDYLHRYIISASRRQIAFIAKQPQKCKDLIRVVKKWADKVHWKSVQARPNSYLLSLLVIKAYHNMEGDSLAKTPSFEKEVLTELALNINEDNLEVSFNEYYDPKDYVVDSWESPVVQDPALPAHNVAMTGIIDWSQFREEIGKWVRNLCH